MTPAERKRMTRLERQLEEARAEADLYQMMAHDLASPGIIAEITRKYPAIAKQWERACLPSP